jgi:hypothetical protein
MVAVKSCDAFTPTFANAGETETEIGGGGVIVSVNEPDFVGSATAVAVTVAVILLATMVGASYSTDVLVCLARVPTPVSAHVTPLLDGSFATTAVMVTDCPCPIVCVFPAAKLTEITGGGVPIPEPQPERRLMAINPKAIGAIRLSLSIMLPHLQLVLSSSQLFSWQTQITNPPSTPLLIVLAENPLRFDRYGGACRSEDRANFVAIADPNDVQIGCPKQDSGVVNVHDSCPSAVRIDRECP